jgi:Putative MetA-pathway of phenol degradation
MHPRPLFVAAMTACATMLFTVASARANHGPGASGGGSATISGEVLKPGHFELELREDYSQFQHFDRSAAIARAMQGGDFDALDHGFFTTLSGAYGVTEDFQLGASIGYFVGNDFQSVSDDNGTITFGKANPSGLTDLVVTGKYRVLSGQPGNLSLITGVVFPTGRNDFRLDNSVPLSPTDQPGTGRWGLPFGVGYSRFLTPQLTVDASALYTYRFESDGFKVGDRFDAGLALAYRLTPSIKSFPQYAVFAELNNVYLLQDQNHGSRDPNSGSDTLYITPGFRMRFNPAFALTVAPSFPVFENLNGDQGRVDFKVAISLSFSH